jgi:hydroxymethylpyrimidine/phosphomethylpyrimidine kinase
MSAPELAPPPTVLVFAATDPTGGAGLQADLLALSSLGCHALSVVTAVTVQDTLGVEDFLPIDPEWISDQARAVLEDMPVAAFKLGMLGSVETVQAIAEIVADYPDIPLVYDPVLASGRGDDLATEEMIEAVRELLLPQVTLLTPNSLEARRLAEIPQEDEHGEPIEAHEDEDTPLDLDTCALRLQDMGCEFVLITGSHEHTPQVVNALYTPEGDVHTLSWDRLPDSYHGSGCTLSSAIAALLAQGIDMETAVKSAQEYTWEALRNGWRLGMGQFIPDRLFWARGENEDANEDE